MTRRDLSPGLQAAQACHGAFAFATRFPGITKEWLERSNFLVVVTAADEDELAKILERAGKADICRTPVREPDLDNALTAVVLEPGDVAKRICASLPLALKEPVMSS